MNTTTSNDEFQINDVSNATELDASDLHLPTKLTHPNRGIRKTYEYYKEFNTINEGKELLKQNCNINRSSSDKTYYRCKFKTCPMSAYLEVNKYGIDASAFISEGEHQHFEEQREKLSKELKDEIEQLYDQNITQPSKILSLLKTKGKPFL